MMYNHVLCFSGNVYISKTKTVKFSVINKGETEANVSVIIKDDLSFVHATSPKTYTVRAGSTMNDTFIVHAGPTEGQTTYVIYVTRFLQTNLSFNSN